MEQKGLYREFGPHDAKTVFCRDFGSHRAKIAVFFQGWGRHGANTIVYKCAQRIFISSSILGPNEKCE